MSRKEPVIITMDMIDFVEHPYAICQSRSSDSEAHTINYVEKTCTCRGFQYSKKDPKECAHVTSVLRFLAIKRSQQG